MARFMSTLSLALGVVAAIEVLAMPDRVLISQHGSILSHPQQEQSSTTSVRVSRALAVTARPHLRASRKPIIDATDTLGATRLLLVEVRGFAPRSPYSSTRPTYGH